MTSRINKVINAFRKGENVKPEDLPLPEPLLDRAPATTVDIITSKGIQEVKIVAFNAMDGWQAKHQMRDYATSLDAAFRRQFTLMVLSRAAIDDIAIDSEDIANRLLEKWENVQIVFKAVLEFNNIDIFVNEDVKIHWKLAGAEIAVAFVAHMEKLMGPGMERTLKGAADNG